MRGDAVPGDRSPRVKICGLGREADVAAAAGAGADYVGLVLAESPRRLEPEEARRLADTASGVGLRPMGVFVDRPAEEVEGLADRLGLAGVQLHGSEDPETCAALQRTDREVWKALRPRSPEELEELAARYEEVVDALLVEGWSPDAAGGTGTPFPHEWLAGDRGGVRGIRLVLAGGLEPENVAGAVRTVRPDVVDVSSGVEAAPGRKDPDRIRVFVEAARSTEPAEEADEREERTSEGEG